MRVADSPNNMPGIIRYFAIGFGCLGAWIGILWLSDQAAKVSRRLAYAMKKCAMSLPKAILAGAMTSMVLGGHGGHFSVFVAGSVLILGCVGGILGAIIGDEDKLKLD